MLVGATAPSHTHPDGKERLRMVLSDATRIARALPAAIPVAVNVTLPVNAKEW